LLTNLYAGLCIKYIMASLQYVSHNKKVKTGPKKEHGKPHKRLSPTVIKKLGDIDSGKVKMITQTSDEFIADMKKELATSES
jgi:hypothetical protein